MDYPYLGVLIRHLDREQTGFATTPVAFSHLARANSENEAAEILNVYQRFRPDLVEDGEIILRGRGFISFGADSASTNKASFDLLVEATGAVVHLFLT